MKLKGNYDSGTSYSVGDVVLCSDGYFYYLFKPCAAGTTPTDSLYWNRLEEPYASCAEMAMSVLEKVPTNISTEAISLFDGETECIVTVDASGDTPELEVSLAESGEA